MARRARTSLCARAQVKLLHRTNQLIFHVLDPHFLQPIGFIDELGRRIKVGYISMRRAPAHSLALHTADLTERTKPSPTQRLSKAAIHLCLSLTGPLVLVLLVVLIIAPFESSAGG